MAHMARGSRNKLLKLEIHPDPKYLMPDPVETLKATQKLVKDGFFVLPYFRRPCLCKQLEDSGSAAVMPLGSPIGSNKVEKVKSFEESSSSVSAQSCRCRNRTLTSS